MSDDQASVGDEFGNYGDKWENDAEDPTIEDEKAEPPAETKKPQIPMFGSVMMDAVAQFNPKLKEVRENKTLQTQREGWFWPLHPSSSPMGLGSSS